VTAAGGAMLTVERRRVGASGGARSLRIHVSSFLGIVGTHPAVFVRVASKGVAGYRK
jgi:hypothetical protein